MKKYVYLMSSIEPNGLLSYKIGVSGNPKKRLKNLQTGNPNKISLLRSYESKHYLKVERWMHRQYFDSKTEAKNEWRTLNDNQVFSFIKDCEKAEDYIKFLLENNSLYD